MTVVPLYRMDPRHPQARACATCGVRELALFGALDWEGLDRIHTHIDSRDLPIDHVLFHAGGVDDALYTLRAGIVRFERTTEAGDRRIVRLAGRGDLIGQEALLNRRFADDVVACTPLSVCRIPKSLILELGSAEGSLLQELMRRWQLALDDAQAWVSNLTTGPAMRRMLHLLLKLADLTEEAPLATHPTIWLPRREDMGAMLDMTVETASRIVSQLRRDGLLTLQPPRHASLDRAGVQAAIEARGLSA